MSTYQPLFWLCAGCFGLGGWLLARVMRRRVTRLVAALCRAEVEAHGDRAALTEAEATAGRLREQLAAAQAETRNARAAAEGQRARAQESHRLAEARQATLEEVEQGLLALWPCVRPHQPAEGLGAARVRAAFPSLPVPANLVLDATPTEVDTLLAIERVAVDAARHDEGWLLPGSLASSPSGGCLYAKGTEEAVLYVQGQGRVGLDRLQHVFSFQPQQTLKLIQEVLRLRGAGR